MHTWSRLSLTETLELRGAERHKHARLIANGSDRTLLLQKVYEAVPQDGMSIRTAVGNKGNSDIKLIAFIVVVAGFVQWMYHG